MHTNPANDALLLEADALDANTAQLTVVRLCVAGREIALEAAYVQSLAPCAHDAPWPTLEAVLGLPAPQTPGRRRCLQLRPLHSGAAPVRLNVPAPLTLQPLAASTIQPLPPLLAACCRMPGLRALSWQPQGLVLLVDVRQLLSQGL